MSELWPYDMNGFSGLNLFIYIPNKHSAELNMEWSGRAQVYGKEHGLCGSTSDCKQYNNIWYVMFMPV